MGHKTMKESVKEDHNDKDRTTRTEETTETTKAEIQSNNVNNIPETLSDSDEEEDEDEEEEECDINNNNKEQNTNILKKVLGATKRSLDLNETYASSPIDFSISVSHFQTHKEQAEVGVVEEEETKHKKKANIKIDNSNDSIPIDLNYYNTDGSIPSMEEEDVTSSNETKLTIRQLTPPKLYPIKLKQKKENFIVLS